MADQGAEGLLSPFLRQQRFAAVRPFLRGRVLDVGCGVGGLADWVEPNTYLGVEVDALSRGRAQLMHPMHRFVANMMNVEGLFDSVVALAVIEHVSDPSAFLASLAKHLHTSPDALVVVTTPHPSVDWVHDVGASLGLFSRHANEEHEELLDEDKLRSAGADARLKLCLYRRFLLGANQLAVFRPDSGAL